MKSVRLWEQDRRPEATELLRRSIVALGNDGRTWYLYASRLRSAGRTDAALEAVKMAVDLQPLDFRGLDLLLDLYHARPGSAEYVTGVLGTLAEHLESRPDLHLAALAYFIPARSEKGLDALRSSPNPVVRLAVQLNDAATSTARWHAILSTAPPEYATHAKVVCLLGRGSFLDAYQLLESMKPADIPIENLRIAIRRELRRGRKSAAYRLLGYYLRVRPDDSWAQRKFAESHSAPQVTPELMRRGYPLPTMRPTPKYRVSPERVFYMLHNSLPYDSAGYATRTHGILKALRGGGWDTIGLTRLGYPWDRPGRQDIAEIPAVDIVDGVPYKRSSQQPSREPKHPIQGYVERYSRVVFQKAIEERPFLLHGASNHWNGLTAVSVARRLGIPSVYEVRGFWEVTRASREPSYADSEMYRYTARMEHDAAAGASAVIAITNALKLELVARGVAAEKISVVPNGVDTARFSPRARNEALAGSLGLADKKVIGYVGSIVDYEGIDLLIRATELIAQDRTDFVVLIVGDGAVLDRIKSLVQESKLSDQVIFTGRVPHSEVEEFYSLIDITPFPRLPLPVCEMVSPLKPLEAMAMGKAVIASNVAALSEMVNDGVTGLLHAKGDVVSLASGLNRLLDDDPLRHRLAEDARRWVVQERDWQILAQRISQIYADLGGVPSLGFAGTGSALHVQPQP